jgi:hypothetical protein
MIYGSQNQDMIRNYPDISIQSTIIPSSWWVEDESKDLKRGRLIFAFLPHVDQIPNKLTPIGRTEGTLHDKITYRIEPLRIKQCQPHITLPVAAMPSYPGEAYIVQRAKRRPCLVLGNGGIPLPKEMFQGRPGWQVSPIILVAPYYGATQDGTRAGFPSLFLDRVRRCEYPQFMTDLLPIGSTGESVLYLNHIQPLGKHHDSIDLTKFCLGDDALAVLDEWVTWIITGLLLKNGLIDTARQQFVEFK